MNISQLLDALDQQVQQGDLLGAVDRFFADNCRTFSTGPGATHSKIEKIDSLRAFFDALASTNRIERLNALVDGDVSYSEFIFDFTDRQGQNLYWHEVIRRRWENGKVVEEQYFTDLQNENPMAKLANQSKPSEKSAAKTPAKKQAAKTAETKKPAAAKTASKKQAAPKAEEPVVEMPAPKKPAAKKTTAPKTAEPVAPATKPAAKPAAKSAASKKAAATDNTDASAESAPVKKTTARKKS